ncbi:hypothetical protein [Azohydromonas aeria]|uniref:hypothetical protein n=1 Tax=Azohydromonas aeria TaxID=2590212 RepID=UPI0012F91BB3|nr:hypothetical protein [Azohydromonas aeria]
MLQPRFSFTAGALRSDSDAPVAAPSRFVVERSLEVPVDALRVLLGDSGKAEPGDPVQLDLGDADGLERVFTGRVAELRPHLGGCRMLCLGTMLALVDLRASGFYQSQSAGDVARDLVRQAGLEAGDIQDGITLPRYAVERRVGAHAQLRRLAQRLGFSLFSDREGKVHFKGLGAAASLGGGGGLGGLAGAAGGALAGAAGALGLGGTGAGLAYGTHLLAAEGALQPAFARRVTVGGESPMSGQGEDKSFWLTATDRDYEDSAGSGDELLITDSAARTKDMAGRFAAGYAAAFARRGAAVRLTALGLPALELGGTLSASGAPEGGLNAGGTIVALRHRFGAREGFVTDVTIAPESGA